MTLFNQKQDSAIFFKNCYFLHDKNEKKECYKNKYFLNMNKNCLCAKDVDICVCVR